MEVGALSSLERLLGSVTLDQAESELSESVVTEFTVPTTGAKLTFTSSVSLVAEFCQLIKSDQFSGPTAPEYSWTQDGTLTWLARLRLPPIATFDGRRTFSSTPFPTKAEAKQHCAFQAALALYQGGALTDQLKPKRVSRVAGEMEDAEGRKVDKVQDDPYTTITTPYPFGDITSLESDVFLNVLELTEGDQAPVRVGLVCGASATGFECATLFAQEGAMISVKLVEAKQLTWSLEEKITRLNKLQQLTNMSLGVTLNRKLLAHDPAHLVLWTPLTPSDEIDGDIVDNSLGEIPHAGSELKPDTLIVIPNPGASTRLYRFNLIRDDVDSLSPTDQVEAAILAVSVKRAKLAIKCPVYAHYSAYVLKTRLSHELPVPILQGCKITLEVTNLLVPHNQPPSGSAASPGPAETAPAARNFPLSICRLSRLPGWWWKFTTWVPSLERLVHDRVSVRNSIARLGLPPATDVELAVLALTPTNANAGYDYETLEFYGDSVLKLLTSVHVFLSRPKMDEGEMSNLRQNSIGNLFLRGRSLASSLATAVLPGLFRTANWVPPAVETVDGNTVSRHVVALKALSDTTEAMLGVGWLSGGLSVALAVADNLGMCTGGTTPWADRPELENLLSSLTDVRLPLRLDAIQDKLGYHFQHEQLLMTAFTHRSYLSEMGYHMERLEFLGDALLEFYVTVELYSAFPDASDSALTFVRARAVSGPTISYIAIRKLAVQDHLIHSSPLLPSALAEAVDDSEQFSWADVAKGFVTWLFQPPKVLGDVVEALIGAVWVDTQGDLTEVFRVLDGFYGEILPEMEVAEVRDPVSHIHKLKQTLQCGHLESTVVQQGTSSNFAATWRWHGKVLGFASASVNTVAEQLAAKDALAVLVGRVDAARERKEDPCACMGVAREEKEERRRQRKLAKRKTAGEAGGGGEGKEMVEPPASASVAVAV